MDVWLKLAAVDQLIMGKISGRGNDIVGTAVDGMAQQLGHRGRQVLSALRRADRPARADRAGVGGDAVSVKSPAALVTVVAVRW